MHSSLSAQTLGFLNLERCGLVFLTQAEKDSTTVTTTWLYTEDGEVFHQLLADNECGVQ